MRRGALGAFAGIFVLLFAAGSASSAPTAAHTTISWRATVPTLPANAVAGSTYVNSISCASRGNCTAVGSYRDDANQVQGLLLTETAGHWAPGVEAVLPGNATSSSRVALWSVSCASAGNCTAVGNYGGRGLLLTQTAGEWAPGVEAVFPPNVNSLSDDMYSVSCVSPGNCTAAAGGVLFTEKAGHWANGFAAPLPLDAQASRPVAISSVSCSSDGNCSAVGTYNLNFGRDIGAGEGVLLTKKLGTWRAVKALMPPDGPGEGVVLSSISCTSGGNCGAIGEYNINIDSCCGGESVLLMEKADTWRRGVKTLRPMTPKPPHPLSPSAVSCPSPGHCVVMSGYFSGGRNRETLPTEAAGMWRRGAVAVLSGNLLHPPAVEGFSCAAPGSCAVMGSAFHNGAWHAFLLNKVAGSWVGGVKWLPANSQLVAVSCGARGSCGAVGTVGNFDLNGVLVDSSP
jgi:hypothetical protein